MANQRGTWRGVCRWAVLPVLLLAALLASCDNGLDVSVTTSTGDDLTGATLLTEHTDDGTATLEDGEFRAPVAPGSASELVIRLDKWITGDLDGTGGADAAAITVEDPGGSGTFYYLHALVNEEEALHDADTAFLGDRIRVEGVSIHDGVITVAMLDRPPDAPFAEAPSVPVIRTFRLAGESLEELEFVTARVDADATLACDDSLPDAAMVIVASPAAGEEVASGFEVSGCSRTHESNVVWRLLDRAGEVLATGFTRGGGFDGPAPFSLTVEYDAAERQLAYLEVFEEDVSEGEGYPPPRVIVPLVITAAE
ncbi:MAG: Gmad2 immunoglobulin-like domain-containing protein [Chloroflexota bacterium]|nr:Gmad2 immunoglobulin-like domain-containing protein [Chloroflexota bacterium]